MRLDLLTDINRDYAVAMNYPAVDRFLVKILWWHLGFTLLMAVANSSLRLSERFPSPFSWRVLSGQEALVATLVGIAAAAIPALVRGALANHYAWRVIVSVAFTVYSYLFVFMSGGSIEMHFHFFMVMALLTVYSDWRLGWVVLVLTAAHHGILNYVAPAWVYFYGRNDLAVIAHALPVTATAIFTSLLCNNHRHSVAILEERTIELRTAKEGADRAYQAKSEFLSRMSHELRTPLNAILGFAQLLEMDSLNPEQRQSVGQILLGGRHLLELINEVLDITGTEAGRLTLSLEPVSVREVAQESLDLVKPLAAEGEVLLDDSARRLPEAYVMADRQRLKQVLVNLLSNAAKYNRQGGTITLTCEERPQERLRIQVSDTGPGIPPDKLERLFTPFDRLGAERSAVDGVGLGLVLSKRLVEAMGGSFGVESIVSKGSTFWIDLGLVEGPIERLVRLGADLPAPAGFEASRKTLAVLYIEDNLSNLTLLQRLLAHRPEVRILPAMHGQLGLSLSRAHRPDLILLDLDLPDIPGEEVLRRLKETPETRHIPVVVISADATAGRVARQLAAGAHAYLTKPLDVKKFLALIDEVLKARDPEPAGPNT